MRPGVSLGVLGYPGVSWGNQTDPMASFFFQRLKGARFLGSGQFEVEIKL